MNGIVILLIAVDATFMPFYGPVLDHHFAERQPAHEHVYLGEARPHHGHPYETLHSHATGPAGSTSDRAEAKPAPDGGVALTSSDGVAVEAQSAGVPVLYVQPGPGSSPGLSPRPAPPSDEAFPISGAPTVIKHPPRSSPFLR